MMLFCLLLSVIFGGGGGSAVKGMSQRPFGLRLPVVMSVLFLELLVDIWKK